MPKIDLNEVELPELTLTLERKLILLAEIDALVESTLELRSAFAAGGHQLDTSAWKLVKTVDDVRAYRSRRALHGVLDQTGDTCEMDSYALSSRSSFQGPMGTQDKTPSLGSSPYDKSLSLGSSTSSSGEGRGYQKVSKKTTRPPAVVISGIIDGTAEDAMLGIISDTEVKFKIRQAYLKAELENARTLVVLVRPTRENPFAYAAVKWGLEPYSHFSQARDFVFLEAAGLTTGSKGEVVAYAARQSVDLSDILDLPRLPNIIRGYMSGCQTFGNMTSLSNTGHPTVEVFSRAFIEMDGSVPVNMAAAAYAEKLIMLSLCMECAYTHKLAYLMRQATGRGRHGSSRQITSSSNCTNCTRAVGRVFFLQLQRGGCCRICQRTFCGRCSVTRKMYVSLGNEVLQKSMLFCLECLLGAKSLDARIVASDRINW